MEIQNDRGNSGNLIITDIQGDMGESTRLNFLLQPDGDVIISIYEIKNGLKMPKLSIEFCTTSRTPDITKAVRKLILKLAEEKR
ncbi:MAG: hypothetical protein Q7S70_02445 [bacterium]|nr:hypothetical protein [bacterium]